MNELAASVERTLQEEARRNALRIAQVRIAALAAATVLDAVISLYPRQTIGMESMSPANALLAGFWLVVALGVALALRAGWNGPAFRVLLSGIDPVIVLTLFVVIIQPLRGTDRMMFPVVVTAAALTLSALTGALRISARAAALSGVLAVLAFAVVAAMIDFRLGHTLFVCSIIAVAGLLGMRVAEVTRRAVAAEANRVILRRLLPPNLADGEPAAALALVTRPRSVEATVLVSDLRGFTAAAEKLEPGAALALLNEVQGRVADCVHAHGGWVDKFMGDGLLAAFGALEPLADHAGAALRAAAGMREAVARLNADAPPGAAPLRIGVGIHSGPVVVGCVGSGERLELTVIGDTVNTASRIEAATKEHGVDVLVSEATRALAGTGAPALEPVGELALRGRVSRLRAWRLAGA